MKTKIVIEAWIPDTAINPTSKLIGDIRTALEPSKAFDLHVSFAGPYGEGYIPEHMRGSTNGSNARTRPARGSGNDGGDGERSGRQSDAAADFADGEPDAEAEAAGTGGTGRKPRSDAGKPRGKRGGAGKEGSAAEGPERAEAGAGGKGRARGHGDAGAAKGREQGGGEGEGRERDGGRSGGRTRGSDGRNGEAARVAAADEDWGSGSKSRAPADEDKPGKGGQSLSEGPDFDTVEEGEEWWAKTPDEDGWPNNLMPEDDPIPASVMSSLLSDHFRAHGGPKDLTFDLVHEMTGAETLDDVDPKDYDILARALLRETAQYKYGVRKKPSTSRGK